MFSFDEIPKLPIPINKMNCSIARTSLARLLRYVTVEFDLNVICTFKCSKLCDVIKYRFSFNETSETIVRNFNRLFPYFYKLFLSLSNR